MLNFDASSLVKFGVKFLSNATLSPWINVTFDYRFSSLHPFMSFMHFYIMKDVMFIHRSNYTQIYNH